MALTNAQLLTLQTDINAGGVNVNTTVGYGTHTPRELAAIYNDPDEATGSPTVDVRFVAPHEMLASVDSTEHEALTQPERDRWTDMLVVAAAANGQGIEMDDTNIRSLITGIWPAGSTRSALAALQTRAATPGEVLFGVDTVITDVDVQRSEAIS